MDGYETYQARADVERAKTLAATDSPFTIGVRFLGGLTSVQQAAFSPARKTRGCSARSGSSSV